MTAIGLSVVGVLLVFTLIAGQQQNFNDHPFLCEEGYKVSSIKRGIAGRKNVGAITVECEKLPAAVRNPTCMKSPNAYVCNGTAEPCHGDSWIGGFVGYELDVSGALLLQPVCCRSDDVSIAAQTCKGMTLNTVGADFDRSIKRNQVFQNFKCWRQYDLNKALQDFVLQPSVCEFALRSGQPLTEGTECGECNCNCGNFACPEGSFNKNPFKLVHKRFNPTTCECRCDCNFKCM